MRVLLLLPLLLLGLSCATRSGPLTGSPTAPVHTPQFTVKKDLIYTPAGWPQALPADLYQPTGPGPWPGVLLIHGGSWTQKDRRSDMTGIAERLARRGYIVLNATYRLAPQHPHPAQVQDLQQAAEWLRQNAAPLRLRADRLATFGYSAGGHLAALVGAYPGGKTARFQAIVAGGAPSDLRKFPDSAMVVNYLGGNLRERPAVFADASPVTHIRPGHPPVFIYHGRGDLLVPVDQASDYQAALKKAGVPHELLWQEGRGHVAAFILDGDAIRPAIAFLDRHLRP
ncbi:MAG: alpha/beta hydrolase [Brevundimonas sp.]|uniref:alpha/beta hydrolase n=1 Tax=Brevundimonas sp. TaxID=1871086 RepID=UPI002732E144|nr:alpha/beta hydrolase [Brevundimonas sp.]MDP3376858.1 alpha/beta hydrolase [Brevundimonas sp.]